MARRSTAKARKAPSPGARATASERARASAAGARPDDASATGGGAALALGVAFLASGAAGLMHEVVWTRLLGHVFGVSSLAVSTVLATYMGGLALGSAWVGGRSGRIADGRRAYAALEIAIGLCALAVPFALAWIEPLYAALWRRFHLSFAAFSVLRFLVAAAILLVPTFLMGATLPVLADDLSRRHGRRVTPQWLYTLNLVGAVLGVALAGFFLLPQLGARGTIFAAALVNLAVGIGVLLFLPPPPPAAGDALPGAAESAATAPRDRALPAADALPWPLLLATAFLSGAVSLAAQVAWSRVLALVVGSTTYAFSAVLLVYMVALALGGILASRIGDRPIAAGPAIALAWALNALLAVAAVYAVHRLPSWYLGLYAVWGAEAQSGIVARGVATAFLVLLPPILCAGTILPLAIAAGRPAAARDTGAAVGRIYAVNTLGSIAGAVLGGFVLIPGIGTRRTLLALALASAATAAALATALRRPRWLRPAVLAAGAAAVVLASLVPPWDYVKLHVGVFEAARHAAGAEALRARLERPDDESTKVLFEHEGRSASVLVLDIPPVRGMKIDARANASDDPGDMATQTMLALYPLLLAPRIDDVLVIGWGSGVTVGAALQAPVRSVTAIELEPAVVEASRFFEHVNHSPLADPRVRLFEDDARHILLASDELYDVIISEPSHPWVAGVANLFTRDFYELAARRLRPDGVMSQWVQSYQISFDTYRTILATFQSVFPEVAIFYVAGSYDTVLVGSRRPLSFDLERMGERFADARIAAELARVGVRAPEHVLAGVGPGPAAVRAIVAGAPINTDDNMLVEFAASRGTSDAVAAEESVLWSLERRATPPEELVPDRAQLLDDPGRMKAYVEGRRLMERDTSRWEAAIPPASTSPATSSPASVPPSPVPATPAPR